MNSVASGIASAVGEQPAATGEIASNIDNASRGTNLVSENISRGAGAADETDVAVHNVLQASQYPAQQAEDMCSAIDAFLQEVKAA